MPFVPDKAVSAKPRFVPDAPAPQQFGSPAAAAGFGRGGRAPSQQTMNAMLDNGLTRTVQGAMADPMGTIKAIPAGINKGAVMLAGLPFDTAQSVVDLGGMAYGAGRSLAQQGDLGASEQFYTPADRSQIPLTGEWNAKMLERAQAATVGGAPVTQNPSPNNPAARLLYAGASGIPGAATGRMALGGAAGGAGSQIVAEAGGGPAAQALAGLAGGKVGERGLIPKMVEPTQTSHFGRDSASAAAAGLDVSNVAPALRDPLIRAAQRGDRDMAQRVVKGQSLPVPIDYTEAQARQDSSLMADEWNMRGAHKDLANRFDDQNQGLIDNLDTIRREESPNVVGNNHIQNGQSLIDSYKTIDAPERAAITAEYQALEQANGGQLPINAKSFVDAADAALSKKSKTDFLPPQIEKQLDRFRESGGMMTFEQYENLRTNLATAARDADRGVLGGGGNASAAINLVRDALETMPFEGVSANLKALADRARSRAKARFDRIRDDPAYRAAVDDDTPIGELSPLADDFVKKHIVSGKMANVKRMQENLSSDPIAKETIAASALNYLKSKTGINADTNQGNFSQHGFNQVGLRDIGPKLSVLVSPKTAELLQTLGEVAQDLQIQRKGGTFNNSNTFSAAVSAGAKNYVEAGLNTVVPGAQLGSMVRKRRSDERDKGRVSRALDPAQYLAIQADE